MRPTSTSRRPWRHDLITILLVVVDTIRSLRSDAVVHLGAGHVRDRWWGAGPVPTVRECRRTTIDASPLASDDRVLSH